MPHHKRVRRGDLRVDGIGGWKKGKIRGEGGRGERAYSGLFPLSKLLHATLNLCHPASTTGKCSQT